MGPGTSMQFCAAQAPEGTAVSKLEQCDWDGDVDWSDLPESKCSGKDATQTQYTLLRAVSQTGQNNGEKGEMGFPFNSKLVRFGSPLCLPKMLPVFVTLRK